MDRINGANTIDIGGGRRGFRSEDLPSGTPGTEVTDLFLNMVQEEILKVVEDAGLVADPGDWTQLLQALKILGVSVASRTRRWISVISMTTTAPPGAPAEGDAYLIPAAATGAWATHVGSIAEWNGTSWSFVTPANGHGISLPDGKVYERIGGAYVEKIALDAQSGKWEYAAAGGTANAITVTLAPAPAALVAGLKVNVQIGTTNTGAATINVNGLGAVAIIRKDGGALVAGDMIAGEIVPLIYDGAGFRLQRLALSDLANNVASGSLIARRIFTASATYTPTPGTKKIRVTLTGGGGAGGGCAATGASTYACGGGGSGGSTVISDFTGGFDSVAMTIGAGGAGVSAGNGGTGGTTSFGALATAPGGGGGAVSGAVSGSVVQAGGGANAPSGGNFANVYGGPGGISVGTSTSNFCSGFGGPSYWGPGANAKFTTSQAGNSGPNYGSGGGGAVNSVSAGANAGGAGGAGVIVVEEYA